MPEKIILQHDGTIDIATGKSRREITWRNRELTWSDLVSKISETHRTAETYSEYMTAKKIRQDEIKDVGGFVGGHLTAGRRKAGNVSHRQLLTLDADSVTTDVWDDFLMLYGNAAALYSTHKHNPDSPRLRLLIPLKKEVFAAEYEAVARKVAGTLGIENFDHTTFEPSRLMYWPSTSKDGVYRFEYNDSEWLDPTEILNSYHNWKDSSEWPLSEKYNTIIQRNITKQGDPLEKPGVIGAFCRTYSIHEVIDKFLNDVYDHCDIEGRYTYKHGSTAAGLITYDDKYAFSHHGTDPVSGKLCNAFDLVRIHKYGLKDEDVREGTPGNKLPSYTAMIEFASKDPKVRIQHGSEMLQEAVSDFSNVADAVNEPEDIAWMSDLEMDRKGNYSSTINNIYLILKNDSRLKESLYFDEFENQLIAKRDLPWRKVTKLSRYFSDDDSDCLAHFLEAYNMPFTQIAKALAKIRTDYKIHPVRNYLSPLKWDGQERLESLLIDYLGAEDNEYTRNVTRKTLVAAVARIFDPGIKFDTVLTIVGKEGIGKSTVIAKLAKEWFSDCLGDIHKKDGMESLRGVWLMEIAELASLKAKEQEAIKRFISSTSDIYRPVYGRQNVKFPRQCIFFATTNRSDFLTGSHGNRRFLPIDTHVQPPTKNVFEDLTTGEIDQYWAEALYYYKSGESLDLSDEAKDLAEKAREDHNEVDERAGLIEGYLNRLYPENWDKMNLYERRAFIKNEDELFQDAIVPKNYVCVAEIWCEVLDGLQRDLSTNNTKYIHDMLRKMKGWKQTKLPKRFSIYGKQRAYERLKKVEHGGNTSENTFLNNENTGTRKGTRK